MPVCPSVADLDDEEAGDPWYISLFFFTPGVARVVPFDNLRHLEQTMASASRQVFQKGVLGRCDMMARVLLAMSVMVVDG